jgi:hypothetical protein
MRINQYSSHILEPCVNFCVSHLETSSPPETNFAVEKKQTFCFTAHFDEIDQVSSTMPPKKLSGKRPAETSFSDDELLTSLSSSSSSTSSSSSSSLGKRNKGSMSETIKTMQSFPETERLMLKSTFPVVGAITFMKLNPQHGRRSLEIQSSHCLELTKLLNKIDPSFQISDTVRFGSWPYKKNKPNPLKFFKLKGGEIQSCSEDIFEVGMVAMVSVTPSKYFSDEDITGTWFLEFKNITALMDVQNDEEPEDPDQLFVQEHLKFLVGLGM